jgi:hypothetical protein
MQRCFPRINQELKRTDRWMLWKLTARSCRMVISTAIREALEVQNSCLKAVATAEVYFGCKFNNYAKRNQKCRRH